MGLNADEDPKAEIYQIRYDYSKHDGSTDEQKIARQGSIKLLKTCEGYALSDFELNMHGATYKQVSGFLKAGASYASSGYSESEISQLILKDLPFGTHPSSVYHLRLIMGEETLFKSVI